MKSPYELMLRGLPGPVEAMHSKHARLLDTLQALSGGFWTIDATRIRNLEDPGWEFFTECSLTRALPSGVKGTVYYHNLLHGDDDASCDDHIVWYFAPHRVDYGQLVQVLLPELVVAFAPYYAVVTDAQLSADQFFAKKYATRECIESLGAVTFLDAGLCERTFGVPPKRLVGMLGPLAEKAQELAGGVLIMMSARPMEADEIDKRSRSIFKQLGGVDHVPEAEPDRPTRRRKRSPEKAQRMDPAPARNRTRRTKRSLENVNAIFEEFAAAFTGAITADGDIVSPRRLSRTRLDYSIESLKHVDKYLDYLQPRCPQEFDDAWHSAVLWGGAYVGEVIRRQASRQYDWVDFNEFVRSYPETKALLGGERGLGTCAVLTPGRGDFTLPVNKVIRYLLEGPENSVWYYARCEVEG